MGYINKKTIQKIEEKIKNYDIEMEKEHSIHNWDEAYYLEGKIDGMKEVLKIINTHKFKL